MIRMEFSLLWLTAILLLAVTVPTSAEKSQHSCPDECRCSTQNSSTTVHCTSLNFIRKLSNKELTAIISLDVSNASVHTLDKQLLKKLVNLEILNLSNNRLTDIKHFPQLHKLTYLNLKSNLIKYFTAKQLPAKLEILDVSRNYIRELPQDLPSVHSLKRIYIDGNAFSCHRESLDTRDALLERNIKIVGRATCNTPSKFQGKFWNHVVDFDEYFKLHNQDDIQADDVVGSGEGSGQIDVFTTESAVKPSAETDFTFEDNEESSGLEPLQTTTEAFLEYEYDGDEGSGSVPLIYVGHEDEENDDHKYHHVTDSFTSPEPEITEEVITKKTAIQVQAEPTQIPTQIPTTTVQEVSTEDASFDNVSDNDKKLYDVRNVQEDTSNESSLGTNIFLVIVVIILVALFVYAIKKNKERKRRKARQKNEDLEKQDGTELLQKPVIPSEKQNGSPESAPLMNGQNEEPEKELETSMASNLTSSPVEMRNKDVLNGSSRDSVDSPYLNNPLHHSSQDVVSVKVKASEIPDSIPRTPILVDRRKTSDGQNIVITPNLNQRASTGD